MNYAASKPYSHISCMYEKNNVSYQSITIRMTEFDLKEHIESYRYRCWYYRIFDVTDN